ncbi:MAG: hypothetical protein ACRDJH_07255 [Thermomicrobiales bacterium]
MIVKGKTVKVPSGSDIAILLARAADTPVVIESDGERFRVVREDEDIWAGYDPDAVQAAFDRAFGILVGIDREALKAELREQREQDSPGRPA